jgi:hypothetical protein
MRLWIGLIGFALILGACGDLSFSATPSAPPTPNPALMEIDPRALAAQLTVTESLAQASDQLAAQINIPVDAVRVLMRTESCLSCAETTSNRGGNALAELTVEEASPLLEPGSHFWLNIPPLACLYLFDGQQIQPQGCRSS